MRKRLFSAAVLVTLAFQGVGGVAAGPDAGTKSGNDWASLPLFGTDSTAQFDVYLACAGNTASETRQCMTVSNAFYAWANNRHIRLHPVRMEETVFRTGQSSGDSSGSTTAMPYRLAVQFKPFFSAAQLSGTGGSYEPGEAGYTATIYVFSGATGELIRKSSMRGRKDVSDQANVTPFVEADAYDVIAQIDPGYSPSP